MKRSHLSFYIIKIRIETEVSRECQKIAWNSLRLVSVPIFLLKIGLKCHKYFETLNSVFSYKIYSLYYRRWMFYDQHLNASTLIWLPCMYKYQPRSIKECANDNLQYEKNIRVRFTLVTKIKETLLKNAFLNFGGS